MSSHVNPRGKAIAIWIAVFTFIILIIISLRFYVITKVSRRSLRLDDAAITLSVASLLTVEGCTLWGKYGPLFVLDPVARCRSTVSSTQIYSCLQQFGRAS